MKLVSGQTITVQIEEATGTDLDKIQDEGGVLDGVEAERVGDERVTFSCSVIMALDDTDETLRILHLLGVQTEAEKKGYWLIGSTCSRCGHEPCEC